MKYLQRRFNRVHGYIFLGFYGLFAALTFLILNAGSESDRRGFPIFWATLGSVSGPFTGAIARHFQNCCWQFSVMLFPYCGCLLGAGLLSQLAPFPFQRWERGVRLALWCVGLMGWFGGGLISFGHALS